MRIVSIPPQHHEHSQRLLNQMYRLRAAVFSERLRWNVDVTEAGERDDFDNLDPTYILAVTQDLKVVGSVRLLPALGPTMLEQTFPQLLAGGSFTASASMLESSRFCVDTSWRAGRGGAPLHVATLTMFAGIIEWSISNGYDEIVTATDLRFERILRRTGWPMKRLGVPVTIGRTVAVAGRLSADQASFDRVCPAGYRSIIASDLDLRIRSAA
ncbi:acyl-homoserine-lactone synthase [Oryzicola mucosus]|uniref:Acyl-homoserine-lactone synthase n=1 Tax=Oryzicola mucosus TaxID=2767425 RepID=A0A8J6PLJ0_9HYPH|nr:acyl-homoserine-lactone synthase TraI [Oryzicola mucosus]MBD0416809.1 GNAT family N-acetyltransferase [Oryzicola mucosus]